jgi:hypothetical protein
LISLGLAVRAKHLPQGTQKKAKDLTANASPQQQTPILWYILWYI